MALDSGSAPKRAPLQLIRQAPRGFGNKLKAPDDGVQGLKIVAQALVTMAVRELFGQVDVPEHVVERVPVDHLNWTVEQAGGKSFRRTYS
jgi:hypothetical protein